MVAGLLIALVGWLLILWAGLTAAVLVSEIVSEELGGEALVGFLILIVIPLLVGWWFIRMGKRLRRSKAKPASAPAAESETVGRLVTEQTPTRPKRIDIPDPVIENPDNSSSGIVEPEDTEQKKRPLSSEEMLEQAKKRRNRS